MATIECPLSRAAREFGGATALISDNKVINYYEYDLLVSATAEALRRAGVRNVDRIAVISDNRLELPILFLAALRLGATVCPINPRFPNTVVDGYMSRVRCQWLVDPNERRRSSRSAKVLSLEQIVSVAVPGAASQKNQSVAIDLSQNATIIATSGTTGMPKAVLHSYGNHFYSAEGSNCNIAVTPGDSWLLSLPLYHVGGIGIMFRTLLGGGALVMPDPIENLAGSLARHRVTHLSLVSTQLHRLLNNAVPENSISQLKAVLLGGSACPEHLIDRAKKRGWPLFTSYGLTEMTSQVTTTGFGESPEKLHTSGRPLKYRVIDISDRGEILVRGETLFKGYLSEDRLDPATDEHGWFHTGDLGYLDNDGYLSVTGRIDRMFISGGENIHPEEIEASLLQVPAVENAVVIPADDAEFGRRPVAFVQVAEGRSVSSHELETRLAACLPRFKLPVSYFRWPPDRDTDMKLALESLRELLLRNEVTNLP